MQGRFFDFQKLLIPLDELFILKGEK